MYYKVMKDVILPFEKSIGTSGDCVTLDSSVAINAHCAWGC